MTDATLTPTIPFMDMQARLRPLREELIAGYERVLDRGIFVMGPEAAALEEEVARLCNVRYAVAVNSGTAALHLALLALEIGPGDEVITVANTFIATVEAISATGATPVLVDVDSASYLIDVERMAAAITPRTRAVIPVDLYGQICDMDAIRTVAERHHLAVIEDACQAIGATSQGRAAGSFGDAGCFSFYPGKNVGATGEGGMLVTSREDVASAARMLRNHGEVRRYHHATPGWNFRLSEVLAMSVRVQLQHVEGWTEGRRRVAGWYDEALRGSVVQRPVLPGDRSHAFHLYVVQVPDRDRVRDALERDGIASGIHYPVPVHLQDAYRSLGLGEGTLPVSEAAAARLLSLPMYPEMTRAQVGFVVDRLTAALNEARVVVA